MVHLQSIGPFGEWQGSARCIPDFLN
jgi:hypothetical protein